VGADLEITDALLVTPRGQRRGTLVVDDGRIAGIAERPSSTTSVPRRSPRGVTSSASVISRSAPTGRGSQRSRRPSSRSWRSSISAGAPVSGSCPLAVFGNAMTSRIDSRPAMTATTRSIPSAMPPCGGAP